MLKTLSVLSCVAVLCLVGATTASADYPAAVQKAFQPACVKGATSGDGVTKKKARKYCRAVFACIEDKITLKKFKRLSKNGNLTKNRKVKACINNTAQLLA